MVSLEGQEFSRSRLAREIECIAPITVRSSQGEIRELSFLRWVEEAET